jgi:hypothetical protein
MADESFPVRAWRLLIGAPRSLSDRALFHRLSLVPFLAWVGLGADGLSSSAYGPEEAFRTLGIHTTYGILRSFPDHFRNIVFLSVGVIDSGAFKGEDAVDALRAETDRMLGRYVELARGLGLAAKSASRSAPTRSSRPRSSASKSCATFRARPSSRAR